MTQTIYEAAGGRQAFVYLARAVDPAISDAIIAKFPEVGSERQDLRQYPGGVLAANIVGGIDWDGHGLLGLEDSMDSVLAGTDGSVPAPWSWCAGGVPEGSAPRLSRGRRRGPG